MLQRALSYKSFHTPPEKPPDSPNQEKRHPEAYRHIRHVEDSCPEPTQLEDDKIDNRATEQHPVQEITDAAATDECEPQKQDRPNGGDSHEIDHEQPQKTSNGNRDEGPSPFLRQSRFEAEDRPLVLGIMKPHQIPRQGDSTPFGQDRFHYGLTQLIAPNGEKNQQQNQNKSLCSHQ